MSMTLYIDGILPADEQWRKMRAAWAACKEADVEVPLEVVNFFDGIDPCDESGRVVRLANARGIHEAVMPYADDEAGEEGWYVELAKLPPQIKTLRFYASW